MIKIENFNNLKSSGIAYGGHGGSKSGVLFDNERWFLKYPKTTKSMDVKNLSYTTTPLSEYLGSNIYKIIGIDVHETKLGIKDNKLVVACKDFLDSSEIILSYNEIKNEYSLETENELEKISTNYSQSEDLQELFILMSTNIYFRKIEDLRKRFYDMFVVDALIGNNDRNERNWGLVLNKENSVLRLAPVYDNGAAFCNKSDNSKLQSFLDNENKFKQLAYDSSISVFSLNDKKINPLKYIESMQNEELNQAVLRIVPKIDLKKIKDFFDTIPYEYNNIQVFSKEQRSVYYNLLVYRYEKVLLPIYNKLNNKK